MRFAVVPAPLAFVLAVGVFSVAPSAQQKPTFRSGVEVVLIDVNVVDQSHAPVEDLKAADFIVSVDYKPRKVTSAEFIRYDVRTTSRREAAPPALADSAANPTSSVSSLARSLLIVIDSDSMEPGDGLLVRQQVDKFIERMSPDDRIGVATIPRLPSDVTMTKDRQRVKAQLAKVITGSEKYRGAFFHVTLAEAFAMEQGDATVTGKVTGRECCGFDRVYPGCTPKYNGCVQDLMMEVREMQIQNHQRGEIAIEALRSLADSIKQVDGPKTFLFITGGTPPPDSKSTTAYSRVAEAIAAGQVTLYTLLIPQEQLGQVKYQASETPLADMQLEREGVENATSASGGTFMEAIGTYDQYFDRIVTELSGSYLLGVEVQAGDRDGKPHQVSVKVNRKGVDVRARKQYLIERPAALPSRSDGAPARVTAPVSRPSATIAPANAAVEHAATPADLLPLVERIGQYVRSYEAKFLALSSEERSEMKLSRWRAQGAGGGWAVESTRRLAADHLLVKRAGAPGWQALRDVFEVNGQAIRERDARLRSMFLQAPDTIIERASEITSASAAHDINFVDRSANAATNALVLLTATAPAHLVFAKQAEQVVAGVPAWQIAYVEHGEPAFVRGPSGSARMAGSVWADPTDGTIVKTNVRWELNGVAAEITVTYARASDGSTWVPSAMVETYTSASARLECLTTFSHYLKYSVDSR